MFLNDSDQDDLLGTEDMNCIKTAMDSRRSALEKQNIAADIRVGLCDELQAKRRALGIDSTIRELEDTNTPLYEYIKTLEFVQKNIWCPNCSGICKTPSREEIATFVDTAHTDAVEKYNSLFADLKEIDATLAAMTTTSETLAAKLCKISGDLCE